MGSGGYVACFYDFGKTLYGAQSFEISEISELFHEQALFFQDKRERAGYNLVATIPFY